MINSNAKFQFPNELTEQVNEDLNYALMDNRIFKTLVGDFYTTIELRVAYDHRDAEAIELIIGDIIERNDN
jgi:hypothetical protein